MEAAREILHAHGYDDAASMTVGDDIKITLDSDAMMPLVIEKIADNRLSVAHYYTQRGDLMSDPEIVFRVNSDDWTPVRYTQHPHIHQHNEDGLDSMDQFCTQWSRNLQRQGYVKTAKRGDQNGKR